MWNPTTSSRFSPGHALDSSLLSTSQKCRRRVEQRARDEGGPKSFLILRLSSVCPIPTEIRLTKRKRKGGILSRSPGLLQAAGTVKEKKKCRDFFSLLSLTRFLISPRHTHHTHFCYTHTHTGVLVEAREKKKKKSCTGGREPKWPLRVGYRYFWVSIDSLNRYLSHARNRVTELRRTNFRLSLT